MVKLSLKYALNQNVVKYDMGIFVHIRVNMFSTNFLQIYYDPSLIERSLLSVATTTNSQLLNIFFIFLQQENIY